MHLAWLKRLGKWGSRYCYWTRHAVCDTIRNRCVFRVAIPQGTCYETCCSQAPVMLQFGGTWRDAASWGPLIVDGHMLGHLPGPLAKACAIRHLSWRNGEVGLGSHVTLHKGWQQRLIFWPTIHMSATNRLYRLRHASLQIVRRISPHTHIHRTLGWPGRPL